MAYRLRQEKAQAPITGSEQGAGHAFIEPEESWLNIAPSFDDALLIVGEDFSVRAVNKKAESLLEFFFEKGTDLADFVSGALKDTHIDQIKLHIPAPEGDKSFDLFAIPRPERQEILILARETTLQQNLISALMESRKLFKDLVACSSDFAWETNAQGQFQYVSPKGALSYTAEELVGRPARDILCAPKTPAIAFETRTPVDSAELWLRCYDGAEACVSISALPIISREGVWEGARGVCRDITAIRMQEIALDKARSREKLRLNIISAMRDLKAGEQMLAQTALAISDGLPGVACLIARQKDDGLVFGPLQKTIVPGFVDDVMADAGWQQFIINSGASVRPGICNVKGRAVLFMLTEYRHATNGAIFLVADHEDNLAGAPEILEEAASHVGIAIDQICSHEHLERLSRTDDLSGLLNRRAFMQDVEARLTEMNAAATSGAALLYLDLDNLKSVNDQAGHASGDFVIASIGRRLQSLARSGHIAARIGGDEFLLWLDGADREKAEKTARLLVEYCRNLAESTRKVTPPLGLSVGITLLGPSKKAEISELIRNADLALYKAKESGKGTIIILEN